jgi:uncharacterized repeat protein (TIGR03803 family)
MKKLMLPYMTLMIRRLLIGLFALGFVLNCVSAQTFSKLHDFENCSAQGPCDPEYPNLLAQGRDGNLYSTTYQGGTNNVGSVFKVTPSGSVTTIHSFALDGSDGMYPYGGLTLGSDGNFYGTTWSGGVYRAGTVFKIKPSGQLTVLYSFGAREGGDPYAPPVEGADGNYYGVTSFRAGYKVSSSGTYTLLTTSIPAQSYAPLTFASDGNFYGTSYSGPNGQGAVFQMKKTGEVKLIYQFTGKHGTYPYGPVVQGPDGALYGTTYFGGDFNTCGVVFRLTISGEQTVLHNFDCSNGGRPYSGLVAATDGQFYGATEIGGTSNYGVLFGISANGDYNVLFSLQPALGYFPQPTAMQHTAGKIYGLTTAGGQYNSGVFYSLDAGMVPHVFLLKNSGKAGQKVQILGQGLTGTTSVMFGTGLASFAVVSDTYMTATVPTIGTTGSVTVVSPTGTLTSSKIFTVVPVIKSFSPISGPVGTQVTITGSGFIGAAKVTFRGVEATSYTVDSGTQITATVPTGAESGKIGVTTAGGTASKGTFTVTP